MAVDSPDFGFPEPRCFPAPLSSSTDLLIIAGEHSGDEHASKLLLDLYKIRPELSVACLGGERLGNAGAQLLYDLTQVSVVGFVEVIKHYNSFKKLFNETLDWIERYQPKHICFVDYPGFNLRLAKELYKRGWSRKAGGTIGLSYYIGPQVWAWKAKRRFNMARILDQVGVIFPFEVDCYNDTDLHVEFVGHPFAREDYKHPFKFDANGAILLLPGSRVGAVNRIFPVLLESFAIAKSTSRDELRARVIYPSIRILSTLQHILSRYPELEPFVEFKQNHGEQQSARAVLMSSGTMSLAVALCGIPGAIIYRLNWLSYWIGRSLIRVESIGISNLLLKRVLHPEYVQGAAKPTVLAKQLLLSCEQNASSQASDGADEIMDLIKPDSSLLVAEWLAKEL